MISIQKLLSLLLSWKYKICSIIGFSLIYLYFYSFLLSNYDSFSQIFLLNGKNKNESLPLILLYTHNKSHKTKRNICEGARNGGHVVNFERCSKKCEFSCQIEDFKRRSPLAVLFFGEDFYWSFKLNNRNRTSFNQRWIFWSWEAPINHPEYTRSQLTFNWFVQIFFLISNFIFFFPLRTMTYRQDSDIVHDYGRYIARNLSHTISDHQFIDYYLSNETNQSTFNIEKEFQSRKNKISWIVSNCHARTNRHKIAIELNKHFSIDQYGQCSLFSNKTKLISSEDFEQTLFQYKFYLAFENSNCQDYITEKSFYNALAHGSIPIVLGTTENNYRNILPPNSFIHIDHFKNINDLATELINITQSLSAYKFYHEWRNDYRLIVWPSNYYIDNLFCTLCSKLYEDKKSKSYGNFSQWLKKCK